MAVGTGQTRRRTGPPPQQITMELAQRSFLPAPAASARSSPPRLNAATSSPITARKAEEAADTVRAAGRSALVLQADVADAKACDTVVASIERDLGRLDVVVNMASVYHSVPFDDLTPEEWHRQLSVDLHGTFLVSRAAVPLMRRSSGGGSSILRIGSPRAPGPLQGFCRTTSPSPREGADRSARARFSVDQILVNAIAPGPPWRRREPPRNRISRARHLGSAAGAVPTKSRRPSSRSSTQTSYGETIRADGGRHVATLELVTKSKFTSGIPVMTQRAVDFRAIARKNKRTYPSRTDPKSAPGTQPMRPFLIRNSVIAHDWDAGASGSGERHAGSIFRNA